MSDEKISDEEIAEAIEKIRDEEAALGHVLCLVHASWERGEDLLPNVVQQAVVANYETERDYLNGGADQFVWNHGAERARQFGDAWRTVGAVENGDLLHRLADALDELHAEVSEDELTEDPVAGFMEFRSRVSGPFFGIPDVDDELAEALVEWVIERRDELFDD